MKIVVFILVWIIFGYVGQYVLELESFSYIMLLGFIAGIVAGETSDYLTKN